MIPVKARKNFSMYNTRYFSMFSQKKLYYIIYKD